MRKMQLYKFPLDNFNLQYRSNKIQYNGNCIVFYYLHTVLFIQSSKMPTNLDIYPRADGAKRRARVLIPPAIYTRGNESISGV